jgi:long-chain acyl-CoA synthetase
MLVNEFLERSSDRFPDKVALICGRRRLTFQKIEQLANRLANAFIDWGFQKQDRVAIFFEPSVEAIISIFAALKAGGIFVIINPQVKAKKLEYILNNCQAKILVSDADHFREISGVLRKCPNIEFLVLADHKFKQKIKPSECQTKVFPYSEIIARSSSSRPAKRSIDIDLAGLIYTSGSTGFPKGAMLTHHNMVSAADSIIEYLENTPQDIIINVLPLSFDYGLYQVLMAFKIGGTVVQEKSFLYPYKTINLMVKEKVTGFPLVPTIAAILFRMKKLAKNSFPRLRYVTNTAQALPPRYIAQLRKIFPGAKLYSMYGLTECKRVSYLPPDEIDRRPTSVGKAMPNTEAYIVDEDGKKINVPGKVGELVVRGANVMKGYWNLAEETNRVLRPGPISGEKVLYTGDLFKMDNEGFLYFISRKDEMIKLAGALVSPQRLRTLCMISRAFRKLLSSA